MHFRFLKPAHYSAPVDTPRATHVDSKDADTIARDNTLSEKEKTATVVRNIISRIPGTEFKGFSVYPRDPVPRGRQPAAGAW